LQMAIQQWLERRRFPMLGGLNQPDVFRSIKVWLVESHAFNLK
jgi:hypothetical protein